MTEKSTHAKSGFTLIELLVVIAIIAILMGLLFPVVGSVKDSANKVKAKNDIVQLVNATKAYYTEYGRYPLVSGSTDMAFGNSVIPNYDSANSKLVGILRSSTTSTLDSATLTANNPRAIVFMEVPNAKDPTPSNAKSGLDSDGVWHDPWGSPYNIAIDANYDNVLSSATGYSDFPTINTGVIAWSWGKDKTQAAKYNGSDDIISWQ